MNACLFVERETGIPPRLAECPASLSWASALLRLLARPSARLSRLDVATRSRLRPFDSLQPALGNKEKSRLRETAFFWSGRRESNPRRQFGKLEL